MFARAKIQSLAKDLGSNFAKTVTEILARKYQSGLSAIESDFAIAYGIRNFGAHKVENKPILYKRTLAREPRQCGKGDMIAKGERYVRFFTADNTTNPPTLKPVAMSCMRHLDRCEQCQATMLNAGDKRFCSEARGQRHFGMAVVDAEENEWKEEGEDY